MNPEVPSVPDRLRAWLNHALDTGASDLHLIIGYPPIVRLHGDLTEISEAPLKEPDLQPILCTLCTPEDFTHLQSQKNLDFSFEVPLDGRIGRFARQSISQWRKLRCLLPRDPDQHSRFRVGRLSRDTGRTAGSTS